LKTHSYANVNPTPIRELSARGSLISGNGLMARSPALVKSFRPLKMSNLNPGSEPQLTIKCSRNLRVKPQTPSFRAFSKVRQKSAGTYLRTSSPENNFGNDAIHYQNVERSVKFDMYYAKGTKHPTKYESQQEVESVPSILEEEYGAIDLLSSQDLNSHSVLGFSDSDTSKVGSIMTIKQSDFDSGDKKSSDKSSNPKINLSKKISPKLVNKITQQFKKKFALAEGILERSPSIEELDIPKV